MPFIRCVLQHEKRFHHQPGVSSNSWTKLLWKEFLHPVPLLTLFSVQVSGTSLNFPHNNLLTLVISINQGCLVSNYTNLDISEGGFFVHANQTLDSELYDTDLKIGRCRTMKRLCINQIWEVPVCRQK